MNPPSRVKLRTFRKTIDELIPYEDKRGEQYRDQQSPLPISVIPNYMGINLCSVDSIEWTRQEDTQLVSLTIHFRPATPAQLRDERER